MKKSHSAIAQQPKIYFSPYDQKEIQKKLFDLLDGAKHQLLIAMYWVTNSTIIDKIIELKHKNIDIQIIFDESSPNSIELMERLLHNGIVPLVFPSRIDTKMHNKFFIIDNIYVWTGSANFTRAAATSYENVIVFQEKDRVNEYKKAFTQIEQTTFELYLKLLSIHTPDQLPAWISNLSNQLYKKNPRFKNILQKELTKLRGTQKEHLLRLFPDAIIKEKRVREANTLPKAKSPKFGEEEK
jgi:phosphatidylserine/phosphatidylglycerophosphate/cardiolipin synthase-like enzyme